MRWLKVGSVIFGAVAITALGIDAADTLQGSRTTLLGQLAATESGGCPEGMIAHPTAQTFTCVDKYEASVGEDCPIATPQNEFQTKDNIEDQDCGAVSRPEVTPWRHITREQAQLACARSGKRLPSNEEWQQFSAGTPDAEHTCNISSAAVRAGGSSPDCLSASGVFDAVGNVWEWTNEDVFDGQFNGRELPEEGYVVQVDRGGVATLTGDEASELFGEDYFWSKKEGSYGMMRGGFYGSKSDAGVYTTHAATLPTRAGAAIGFRCVK